MKRGHWIGLGSLIVLAAATLALTSFLTAPEGIDEAAAQAMADAYWPEAVPESQLALLTRVRLIAPNMT